MRIDEYEKFVQESDWTHEKDPAERLSIARYGIAAEIGSLAASLKRKILHHSPEHWNTKNEEIVEELGDCLWYLTQLASIDADGGLASVVQADLAELPKEIDANSEFLKALEPAKLAKFLAESPKVGSKGKGASLDDYQNVAILTARTEGKELLDVCVTRLLLYATSIMSRQFPRPEHRLKDDIPQFPPVRTLGMLLWHISAVASIYNIRLSEIAEANRNKLESISNLFEKPPTPLYGRSEGVPENQKFPDLFKVTYISPKKGRLQMFFQGRPLGDELDDNSPVEDGYRFHDVLHLANAAILGWSPVLRSLMGLKRKYDPTIDSAQDGARARIVEEAIVKAVHSEASRAGQIEGLSPSDARKRLFSDASQISYPFLKLVMTYAEGLEVQASAPWEWQRAIVQGHRLYAELVKEQQGTITVDLTNRTVSFNSLVIADIRGPVVDSAIEICEAPFGMGHLDKQQKEETEKKAIRKILSLDERPEIESELRIDYSDRDEISVKASGSVQEEIWSRSILGFRRKWTQSDNQRICLMMAIGAPS